MAAIISDAHGGRQGINDTCTHGQLLLPGARAVVLLAIAVVLTIWVVGENFGAIFAGSATDPTSGPLLVLLAAAYWPARNGTTGSGVRRAGRVVTLAA